MKVIPRIKKAKLPQNEARFIIIDRKAIEEVLLENLMEHQCEYFDLGDTDNVMCVMDWNNYGHLTYAVVPETFFRSGAKLDFDYLRESVGTTTDSLFKQNRYRSLKLGDKGTVLRGQGDGSVVPSGPDPIDPK